MGAGAKLSEAELAELDALEANETAMVATPSKASKTKVKLPKPKPVVVEVLESEDESEKIEGQFWSVASEKFERFNYKLDDLIAYLQPIKQLCGIEFDLDTAEMTLNMWGGKSQAECTTLQQPFKNIQAWLHRIQGVQEFADGQEITLELLEKQAALQNKNKANAARINREGVISI